MRVIDGDTFAADFDLGWGIWSREVTGRPNRVRILGIDTPERGEPGYVEAAEKLAQIAPPGSMVWVESVKLDGFGRTLGNVRLLDGTDLVSLLKGV